MFDNFFRSSPLWGSDLDLWRNVESALWREPRYRVHGHNSLGFEIDQGLVTLRGHATSRMFRSQIAAVVQAVPGVKAIQNNLVADADLTTAVAQALGRDRLTRPQQLRVGAHAGWITLAGKVPSEAVQTAAASAAAALASVRGVLSLPRVEGQPRVPQRRPLQPEAGQAVYASDGPAGQITKVVINPFDRLVSHVVVNANFELGRQMTQQVAVLPAATFVRANAGGLFVTDTLKQLAARPGLRIEDFQQPGPGWQPPFPYDLGTVWWPAQPLLVAAWPKVRTAARAERA